MGVMKDGLVLFVELVCVFVVCIDGLFEIVVFKIGLVCWCEIEF